MAICSAIPNKWDDPTKEFLPCEALPLGVGSAQGYCDTRGTNPSFAERRRPMKFPRLIFLDRFIPNASSLPSESRYPLDFQRRRFQKCVASHARSNGMETRNTLV